MANIFVGIHERELFRRIRRPNCHYWYVDDTFCEFYSELESENLHRVINKLPFDLNVKKKIIRDISLQKISLDICNFGVPEIRP